MKSLFKQLRQERLSKQEHDAGREYFRTFIEEHPVQVERKSEGVRRVLQESPLTSKSLFVTPRPMFASIMIAIALALTGGASVAAHDALPGDALYPVKVEMNERVQTALAIGAEHKAEVAAKHAERRLEEATRLAATGELSEAVASRLQTRFDTSIDRANERIATLESNGNTEAAERLRTKLDARLEAHEAILATFESDVELTAEQQMLLQAIGDRILDTQASIRERVLEKLEMRPIATSTEAKTDAKAAAEAQLRIAKKLQAEVESGITRAEVSGEVSAEVLARATARFNQITKHIADGEVAIAAESYNRAFVALHTAQREAHQLLVHLKAAIRAEILAPIVSSSPIIRLDGGVIERIETRIDARQELRSDIRTNVQERIEDRREDRRERIDARIDAEGGIRADDTTTVDVDIDAALDTGLIR